MPAYPIENYLTGYGAEITLQANMAVQLRRIADALEKRPDADSSVMELARQAAQHHGVVILDVTTQPDGKQTQHAEALWEPEDERHPEEAEGRTGD